MLGDISTAYKLIEEFPLDGLNDVTDSLHYYGVNTLFVMNTINLLNVLKHNKILIDLEATPEENDFLYHDYIAHFQNIISCHLNKGDNSLKQDTFTLIQKTNYRVFSNVGFRHNIK